MLNNNETLQIDKIIFYPLQFYFSFIDFKYESYFLKIYKSILKAVKNCVFFRIFETIYKVTE